MALGQKVPLLSEYIKLLPSATQRDDIEKLKLALVRLPKRVVVLLDEIDRMEKEEIVTLLKVIRGISTLPNLSFVCAGDLRVIIETVKGKFDEKNAQYFEKFFPVVISVPDPSPDSLRAAGVQRLVATFSSRAWFENDLEREQFRKDIGDQWDGSIAPFCQNLRSLGLLSNAVSVAAAPLRREVNPIDLTLIEMLNRFRPAVYMLIAKNSVVLTGGEGMVRGGQFQTEASKLKAANHFLAELQALVPELNELEKVKAVLKEMFPRFSTLGRADRPPQPRQRDSDAESEKRIREAGIFPAYFRYELPDAIYSFVEIASLRQRLENAANQPERDRIFSSALHSMEKGSLKRDDFLRKLADLPKVISVPVARSLGLSAVRESAAYTYDTFPTFAEAGQVLRLILAAAQRLSQTERITFLNECITVATDDTMALRILTVLTQQKDESKLDVVVADLYPSFISRMRKRYGQDADAASIDLSTSDPWAFDYWGHSFDTVGVKSSPEDRDIQNDFWLRYIGDSRARLAEAFRRFFLPIAVYSDDAALVVQNKISIEDLERLYNELPDAGDLTGEDHKSLARLRRLLDGEFKNGIDPVSNAWR